MKIFTHLHGGVSLFEFQNKCAAFNIRLEQVRLVIAYARATFDTLRLEQFSVFFCPPRGLERLFVVYSIHISNHDSPQNSQTMGEKFVFLILKFCFVMII
jgi:hypothetical protein